MSSQMYVMTSYHELRYSEFNEILSICYNRSEIAIIQQSTVIENIFSKKILYNNVARLLFLESKFISVLSKLLILLRKGLLDFLFQVIYCLKQENFSRLLFWILLWQHQ